MSWQRGGTSPCDFYRRIEEGMTNERMQRILSVNVAYRYERRDEPPISTIVDQDPGDEQ